MSFFQMAPKLFLSDQTHSNRCEYALYVVWFNKIDHIHTYGAAKVIMFFFWVFYSRIFSGFSSSMALSFFQLAQGLILSIQTPSDISQYDVYKVSSKKMGGRCPLAVSKLKIVHTNKIPNFTCYLSHICTIQSTRIWNLLSIPNSLHECLKDVW
jgi:hypothetical protein